MSEKAPAPNGMHEVTPGLYEVDKQTSIFAADPTQASAARLTARQLADEIYAILISKGGRSLREDWAEHLEPVLAQIDTLRQEQARLEAALVEWKHRAEYAEGRIANATA